MIHADVVREPIDPQSVMAQVGDARDGAALLFLGIVRNHAEGRAVSGIEYDAYEAMARDVLRAIATEAAGILGTDRIAVVHRVGELTVGECSAAIAVSSPHRDEAYRASRYVIEEIKKRLPVWKKERYTGGEEAWVAGTPPAPATPGGTP